MDLTFSPVDDNMSSYQIYVAGEGKVSIPLPEQVKKADVHFNGKKINCSVIGRYLTMAISPAYSGKKLDVVLK